MWSVLIRLLPLVAAAVGIAAVGRALHEKAHEMREPAPDDAAARAQSQSLGYYRPNAARQSQRREKMVA